MGVEGGAFSVQSKTIPNASQFMQTILNSVGKDARSSCDAFMLVILFPENKAAWRNMTPAAFAVVGPDGTMSGPITLSLSRDAATKPVR
jgi:hypothetical protein